MLIVYLVTLIKSGLIRGKSFKISELTIYGHPPWVEYCGFLGGESLMYEGISQARLHFEDS